jgi:RHS repeat-associated protein
VLGSWTGPNVVAEAGNRVRYFQYNDLGTVLAQTKADGTLEGAWEPDHFGNYEGRYAYSGSPARPELGLTGKIYDPAVGLYYFHARWYDSGRGRWTGKEPSGSDGPNLYHFVYNNVLNGVDITGLGSSFGWPLPLPGDILESDEEIIKDLFDYDCAKRVKAEVERNYVNDPSNAGNGYKFLHCMTACMISVECGASGALYQIGYEIETFPLWSDGSGFVDNPGMDERDVRWCEYGKDTVGDLVSGIAGGLLGHFSGGENDCLKRCGGFTSANDWGF